MLFNILITIVSLVYVFGVVAIMDLAVKKGFPQDLSRKVVHVAAGSWLIFWLVYDSSHWTKYLNITAAFIWTILLLLKGFTAKPDDQAVKTMTRTGDRKELLRGPLYFTLVMNLLGTVFYSTPFALTAMGFLTWGDGLAPVVGTRYGKHSYKVFSNKTIEGSITFFVFGLTGAVLFNILFGQTINLKFMLLCAAVATIVEGISPKDFDNIFIPLSIYLLYSVYHI
ncbi:MAG: phosphatidate cytidylyltransferase [Ignavibacteriales bacterium]|nr:phosphatidate cytidylyltransferase [Ignavibacteriales bacterium]